MFSLIKFRSNECSVVKSKHVKNIVGNTCTVKTNHGKYSALLLDSSDDRRKLVRLSKSQNDTALSEINSNQLMSVNENENELQQKSPESNSQNQFKQLVSSTKEITNRKLNNVAEENHCRYQTDVVVEIHESQQVIKSLCKNQLKRTNNSLLDNFATSCDENEEFIKNNIETLNLPDDRISHHKTSTTSQNELLPLSTINNTENEGNFSDLDNSKKSLTLNDSTVNEIDMPLNVNDIVVPYSKTKTKKHFCIFCKTLHTKLPRHLFSKHKKEEEIKRAFALPINSQERTKIMDSIRKKGDFEHNTSAKYNTGVLIVTRQQQSTRKNVVDDYVCCKTCKGFFSKNTLRFHRRNCGAAKGSRYNLIESRRLTQYIHSAANTVLKTKIFPVLRVDKVTKSIRYDELAIKFGNYMTEKYSPEYQHEIIRANLRLLGRFITEMKKLDPSIKELKDIYKLNLMDKCTMAIRNVAKWNETLKEFEVPAVAQQLTAVIKNCGNRLRLELIKEDPDNLKAVVENFILLWEEESALINKNAVESKSYKENDRKKLARLSKSQSDTTLSEINSNQLMSVNENENELQQKSPESNSQNQLKQLVSSTKEITNRKLNNVPEENHCRHQTDAVVEIHESQQVIKSLCKNQLKRTNNSLLDNFATSCDENEEFIKNNIETLDLPDDRISHHKTTTTSQNELLPLSTRNNTEKENVSDIDNPKRSVTQYDNIVNEIDMPLNVNEIFVPYSRTNTKKHFCIFCKTLHTKLPRHLFSKHKKEEEIKRAFALPINSQERTKIMDSIRKKGDFEHNTSAKYNTGVLIVSRQQQSTRKNVVDDYVCCKTCKGFFSKNTLRIHKRNCGAVKGSRYNRIESRRLTQYIHSAANTVLKTKIFPVLRVDKITKSIRYDELAIKFGNYMTEKYSAEQQQEMIRATLRLLGRFIIEMKKLDPSIKELKDIYKLNLLDKCTMAIRNVAKWNETLKEFEVPAVAQQLTAVIKNCGKRLRIEVIGEDRDNLKAVVENFLLLWEEESASINKYAVEGKSCKKSSGKRKRKRKRSRRSSSGRKEISSLCEDVNGQNNIVETLNLSHREFISNHNSNTTQQNSSLPKKAKITENSLKHETVHDLISDTSSFPEYPQNSSCDMSEFNSENSKNSIIEKDDNVSEIDVPLNVKEILVPYAKTYSKKHFCIFCKTLHTKIRRHLYLLHKNEEEIKRALTLPKNCLERMKIMNNIRKKGDFEHNTSAKYNSGILIVSRQQQNKCKNEVDDYVCCETCKGFFSKRTIRIHKSGCGTTSGSKHSKSTESIHSLASYFLKNRIFPLLGDDEITNSIRHDELVIKFGNYLTFMYNKEEDCKMIREDFRLLGFFIIEIKKLYPSINELKNIYQPNLIDKCSMALQNVADLNKTVMEFEIEAVPKDLKSLIAQCGRRHRLELMKEGQDDLKDVENFLSLWEDEMPVINKNYNKYEPNKISTRKIRWSDYEREAVSSIFGDLKSLERLPTLTECSNAIRQTFTLSRRTPEQLKSWIDNQRRYKL